MKLYMGMTMPIESRAALVTRGMCPVWVELAKQMPSHLFIGHLEGQEVTVLITDEPIRTYNQAAALTGHQMKEPDFPVANYATTDAEEARNMALDESGCSCWFVNHGNGEKMGE